MLITDPDVFSVLEYIEKKFLNKDVFRNFFNEWHNLQKIALENRSPQVLINGDMSMYDHYYIMTNTGEIHIFGSVVDRDILTRAKKENIHINYD